MWQEICNNEQAEDFMYRMFDFHDSCIKELCYVSGAYVNEELAMHPANDNRVLKVILQRQFTPDSMVELEFSGLKKLKLAPVSDEYTCEILGTTLVFVDDLVYWFEGEEENSSILVCAEKLRWRPIENAMGNRLFWNDRQ